MSEIILTRNELYNLVWSEPMLKLSRKYAISDNGLRKICISMDIPMPRAGHWMKLQAGKIVLRQKLPDNYTGKTTIALELREEGKVYDTDKHKEAKRLENEMKDSFQSALKVPERLSQPDPQSKMLRDYLEKVEQKAIKENSISEDLREWLSWARKKADWYDPMIEGTDELLQFVDREGLCFKKK